MELRTVRRLKWASGFFALLVFAVVLVFLLRKGDRPGTIRAYRDKLGSDVASSTRKIHYEESRDGKVFLEVDADRNTATTGGVNHLRSVRVVYRGERGDQPDTVIRADECLYSTAEDRVDLRGRVEVGTSDGYRFASKAACYDKKADRVSGEGPFTFSGDGISGSGSGFNLNLKSRELGIAAYVVIEYAPKPGDTRAPPVSAEGARTEGVVHVRAGSATLSQNRRSGQFSGGASMLSDISSLSGAGLRMEASDGKTLKTLECVGDAVFRRREGGGDLGIMGDVVRFQLREGGTTLETVSATGAARMERGDSRLSAPSIEAGAGPGGKLDRLSAGQGVRFDVGAGAGTAEALSLSGGFHPSGRPREMAFTGKAVLRRAGPDKSSSSLAAETVRFEFPDADSSGPSRVRASGGAVIRSVSANGDEMECRTEALVADYGPDGRSLKRADTEAPGFFRTSRPALRDEMELNADRLWLTFFPGTQDPQSFQGDGHVILRRKDAEGKTGESESDSIRGAFSPKDRRVLESVTQRGHFAYRDGDWQAQAETAEFRDEVLALSGRPSVRGRDAETRAGEIRYDRRSGSVVAKGAVQTLQKTEGGRATGLRLGPKGKSGTSEPVWVHSDTLRADGSAGTAVYEGNCRMVQGAGVLKAGRFTMDKSSGLFTAEDSVMVRMVRELPEGGSSPLEIRSRRLRYEEKTRKLRMDGGVRTQSADGALSSDSIDGIFNVAGDLSALEATGGVRIERQEVTALGDSALYDMDQGKVTLSGEPASADEKGTGRRILGRRLIFYQGDDRIRVETGALKGSDRP